MDINAIVMLPEVASMTAEQIIAYGDETVAIGTTDELWSYSGVSMVFGDAAAEGLRIAIEQMGLVGGAQVYLTRGIQLSLPQVQDKLTAIGLEFPALTSVCNGLKEIGITHGTRWQLWHVAKPMIEDIEVALIRKASTAWWATISNEIVQPGIAGGMSIEQLKAAIAGA